MAAAPCEVPYGAGREVQPLHKLLPDHRSEQAWQASREEHRGDTVGGTAPEASGEGDAPGDGHNSHHVHSFRKPAGANRGQPACRRGLILQARRF